MLQAQLALMLEQDVVHLPEAALRGGSLRGLSGDLRVWGHFVERQVAPDVAHFITERGQQLADDSLRLSAVRALEVAVLEQRDARVVWSADVVALGIDLLGEVAQVLGRARELTRPHGPRQGSDDTQDGPCDERGQDHRSQGAQPGLIESLAAEGEA